MTRRACPKLEVGTWVRIRWHDAASHERWISQKDAEQTHPQKVETVGYVVVWTRKRVVLAQSVGREGDKDDNDLEFLNTMVIPSAWIIEVLPL